MNQKLGNLTRYFSSFIENFLQYGIRLMFLYLFIIIVFISITFLKGRT